MRHATTFAAIAFLVVGLCLASPIRPALASWNGRATAHFAIFTTQSDAGAQELLERLERARLFFEKSGWTSDGLKQRVKILAFSSEQEFDAYRPMSAAFAFYQRTREGDFVFMRSLEREQYSVVVHEYTHFIVEHSGLKLPLWLNEGLADFYSTMESRQAQVAVGAPPPGREETLRRSDWMDWQTLASVDYDSPYYRQAGKMGLFYAQSWALVHWLTLNQAYEDKLRGFLTAISNSSPEGDVWSATYHKTLPALGSETQEEFKANRLKPRLFDLDIRPGVLQSAEVADPVEQTEFALAEVQAANPKAAEEARVRLEMLAAKYPDDPRADESLGFLMWRTGRKNDAEHYLTLAVKKRSNDPEALYLLAHLELARGEGSEEPIDLLERALAGNPKNYNALLELGFAAAGRQKFELAADALGKIGESKPEHAFNVAYTLAYCLSELNQNERARAMAEQSRKMASNAHDKKEVTELLAYIQQELKEEEATK